MQHANSSVCSSHQAFQMYEGLVKSSSDTPGFDIAHIPLKFLEPPKNQAIMKSSLLASVAFVAQLASAQYLVAPPDGGTAAPGASPDCSYWIQQSYSLSCADIEAYFSISEATFESYVCTR